MAAILRSIGTKAFNLLTWSVSALLSVRLFIQLGVDTASAMLLGSLALTLEVGKLIAIRRMLAGCKGLFAILTLALTGLSLFASAGSAMQLLDERRQTIAMSVRLSDRTEEDRTRFDQGLVLIDRQSMAVLAKLEATPAEWAGTVRGLREELERLRVERAAMASRLGDFSTNAYSVTTQADMFTMIAQAIHVPVDALIFAFLMSVAFCLEMLIFCTSRREEHKPEGTAIHISDEDGPKKIMGTDQQNTGSSERAWRIQNCPNPITRGGYSKSKPGRDPSSVRECKGSISSEPGNQAETVQIAPRRPGRPRKPVDVERLLPEFSSRLMASADKYGYASKSRDTIARELGITSWVGKTLYKEAVRQGVIETRGRRTVCREVGYAFHPSA